LGGLLVALGSAAFAQAGGVAIEAVDSNDYPDVALTVSVESQLIGGLEPEFRIMEGGEAREVAVTATASDDLKVVLALDVSGSMRGAPLLAAQAASIQFIETMPAGVEMAVVPFGSTPNLAAEFTADKATLLAAVDSLVARGETALYDGVAAAATLLAGEEEAGRTIVLVSDGGDTVSSRTLDDAVESLGELGAAFYAIELQSPENDRAALDTLAAAAGGTVVSADDPAALETTFGDIASELLSSYRLVFTATSYDLADLEVFVVGDGRVLATGTRTIRLPAAPVIVGPDPEVEPEPLVEPEPVVEPDPLPPPRVGAYIELTFLQRGPALWLGLAAVFLAMVTVFTVMAVRPRSPRPKRGKSTLTTVPSHRNAVAKRTPLTVIAESATALAEQALNRGDRFRTLNRALERAGVALRPGEFIVLVGSAVLAATALGLVLLGAVFALLFGIIVALFVPMWLSSRSRERSSQFNEQLGDTLQLMSASMRAGYGLLQAVDAVAEEAPSPTAEEFSRIKIETHLGRDLDDALQAAAQRVDSEDFRWVAEAIQIHRQIGGDLAEILDSVNETIRDRNRIRRRIKALSAEGRVSAIVLSLIPIVMAVFVTIVNPDYIGELTQTGIGQVLIVGGIIAWLFAVMWMRRMVRLIF
jgi:tight adherence protein B